MKNLFFLSLLFSLSAFGAFKPLDPELKNFSYPYPVKFHTFSLNKKNFKMAFMVKEPTGDKKGSVVLLHGKNFSGAYWEKTANDLSSAGYQVVIPDQIGFGKSSKPENFPFTFQLLATLTHDILQTLKIEKYIVVGHSMGGMLATRMALMYPDEVLKLALINPIGLEDWKTLVPYKDVRELYQQELKQNEESIRNYQKNVYFAGNWKPEYDKGIEMLVGWTLHKEFPRIAWNAALTADMIFTQPVVYEFKNLKMPTLLLLGTRDRTALGKAWAPKDVQDQLGRYDLLGKKVIKDIPNGTLVELDNIGHMPQVEDYGSYWKNLLKFIQ